MEISLFVSNIFETVLVSFVLLVVIVGEEASTFQQDLNENNAQFGSERL